MLKYYKNFILCGEIDYFCLLCNESFELVDEVEKHIRWEQHRKLFKVQEYLPRFRKDSIYKLVDKYYCEVCNYVTSAFGIIKNHVQEESHKTKKAAPEKTTNTSLVKREHNFVTVSKIVMNKKEWHGVINDQCLLCNMVVVNFSSHSVSPGHMISLIQSLIIKEQDDQVYRKISEGEFYCFVCKKLFSHEFLTNHWTSSEHIGQNKDGTEKLKLLFDVDKENATATCVVCNETIDWCFGSIKRHRENHIAKGEWKEDKKEIEYEYMQLFFRDKGKARSQLKKYGKDKFIKMNEGGSKGHCMLCNAHISAHMMNFREHVNGLRHNNFLQLKGLIKKTKKIERAPYKIKPFMEIFKEVIHIISLNVYIVPFAKMAINMMNFMLVAPFHKKFICYACDEVFTDVAEHWKLPEHKYKMFKADVVDTPEEEGGLSEFIREIRPGLYHCAVCNVAYAGWSVMKNHLRLLKHRLAKADTHKLVDEIVDPTMIDDEGNYISTPDLVLMVNLKPNDLILDFD